MAVIPSELPDVWVFAVAEDVDFGSAILEGSNSAVRDAGDLQSMVDAVAVGLPAGVPEDSTERSMLGVDGVPALRGKETAVRSPGCQCVGSNF